MGFQQNQIENAASASQNATPEVVKEKADTILNMLEDGNLSGIWDKYSDSFLSGLGDLVIAVVVIVIGLKIIKRITKVASKGLEKAGVNDDLRPFFTSIVDIALKVFLFMTVAGIVGFDLTGLIGILAAASFAVGLALQGSLSNFAAGILILILKPYKIGDWVEIQDRFGKVEAIQIFNTIIVTPGQKTLIIPNGQVIDGVITNFSEKGAIRLELLVTMPYEESFPKVKQVITDALKRVPNILQDPIPKIGIENFDSHNITISIRPFILPNDYWDATYDTLSEIKKAFSENGIKVAYSEGVELGPIGG